MRLPPFDYASPTLVDEAVTLLADAPTQARVLAGGTDLLPAMKRRCITPGLLVNIKGIAALNKLAEQEDGSWWIGAGVSVNQLKGLAALTALSQAASRVAAHELRQMGTLGGNILLDNRCWYYNRSWDWWRGKDPCYKRGGSRCYVFPSGLTCRAAASSDLPPVLIALGARVDVVSATGNRSFPVKELYQDDGARPHTLLAGEIMTGLVIPPSSAGTGSAFVKLAKRQTLDFALVNAAARITLAKDGVTCKEVAAAVSGSLVAPTAVAVEGMIGEAITMDLLDSVAAAGVKCAGIITHAGAMDVPAGYRRQVMKILLARCLEQAWSNARNEVG